VCFRSTGKGKSNRHMAEAAKLLRHAKIIREDAPEEAIAAAAKAGSIYKKAKDAEGMLAAFRSIASSVMEKDLEQAAQLLFEKQESFSQAGDRQSEAAILISITELHLSIAHGGPATLEPVEQALAVFKEAGNVTMEAEASVMASRALMATGDAPRAIELAQQAVTLYSKIGTDAEGKADALLELSKAYTSRSFAMQSTAAAEAADQQEKALQAALDAIEMSESHARSRAYQQMADVMLSKYKPAEAMRLANEALAYYKELGSLAGEFSVYPTLISIHIQKGEPKEALKMLRGRLATYQADIVKAVDSKKPALAARLIKLQANLSALAMAAYIADADTAGALQVGKEVMPIFQGLGDRLGEASTSLRIAEVYLNMKLVNEGILWATKAWSLFKELGNKAGIEAAAAVQSVLSTEPGVDILGAMNRAKALDQLLEMKKAIEKRDALAFKQLLETVLQLGGTNDKDFHEMLGQVEGDKDEMMEWLRSIDDIPWANPKMRGRVYDRRMAYMFFRMNGMGYGPHFRCLHQIAQFGPQEIEKTRVHSVMLQHAHEFPEEGQSWEDSILMCHPGLADCALQSTFCCMGVPSSDFPGHPEAADFESNIAR